MNNSVMVDSIMFASAGCESASSARTSSSSTGEPKRAFAETPPLAEIRDASRPNETDSSEVSPESDVDREQSTAFRKSESEKPVGPQTAEGESGEVQIDLVAAPTVAVAGEAPVVAGDFGTVLPSQGGTVDVETVAADPVFGQHGVVPGVPMVAGGNAQSDADLSTAAMVENNGVVTSASTGAGVPDAPAENLTVASETAQLPQGNGDRAMPLSQGDAAVAAAAGEDQATGAPDAIAKDQALQSSGSDPGVVVPAKADAAVSVVSEIAEAAQTQSGQQASSENSDSGDLQKDQPTAAVLEMVGKDAASPPAEQAATVAPALSDAQSEGQVGEMGGHAKATPLPDADGGVKIQTDALADALSNASSVSEPTPTHASSVSSLEGGVQKDAVQNVGDQILDSVHASMGRGDRQIQVRLDPPELGSVTVRFQEQDGQITGVLEVSKDQIRQEVEQALPQVVRGLQEAGVLVRRLDVVVADQSDGEREPLSRDAWGQGEGSQQHHAQAEDSPAGRWSRWAAAQQGPLEPEGSGHRNVSTAQDRIDMLV